VRVDRECTQGRQAQRPHDPDLVDLGGTRPADRGGVDPGGGSRGDIVPTMRGDELRVAQPLRDPPSGRRRSERRGSDGDGARERAPADLVARDDDLVFAQQAPLDGQPRRDDTHPAPGPAPREHGMVPVDRAEAVERPGDEEARPTTLPNGTNPLLG
jgi:hypothetical protein